MQLMQPKTDDPAQQQSNAILKVLPLMIGWFSLNVPAALCVYWFINNIVTTALTLYTRSTLKVEPVAAGGASSAAAARTEPQQTIFAPPREKPTGFGGMPVTPSDGVKPITDAVIVEDDDDDDDFDDDDGVTDLTAGSAGESSGSGMGSDSQTKRGGGKKRKKKKRQG